MGAPTVQQLYWYDNRKFGSTPLSHSRHCKGGLCVAMGVFGSFRGMSIWGLLHYNITNGSFRGIPI